jgi:hypothetical protein
VPDRPLITSFLPAAAVALPAAIVLYVLTGTTLGLFFGGVLLVTIVLPPMILLRRGWLQQALIAAAVNDSVGLVWLASVLTPHVSLMQWLMCYLTLASYSFALWALTRALASLRIPPVPAAAGAILAAVLWLGWPLWLARLGADRMVGWLTAPHPLLTINGVLSHLGIWSERPIAYGHLVNLGQDVAYRLPDGIGTAVFVHLIAGGILFAVASFMNGGGAVPARRDPGDLPAESDGESREL